MDRSYTSATSADAAIATFTASKHDSPSLCVVPPCNQEQDADDPDQEAGLPGIGAANLAHFGNTIIPGPALE